MKAALCLAFLALPAMAEEEINPPISCNRSVCIADKQFIKDLLDAHNAHVDEIRNLEAQLKAEQESKTKTCAQLEVVPDKPKPCIPKGDRNL